MTPLEITAATTGINTGITGVNNILGSLLNQFFWNQQAKKSFQLNEKAADNAMKRSIDMYNLMQSPAAMVKQFQDAGLSKSLMYGNGGGLGGKTQAGPQGGANGMQGTQIMGLQQIDPLTIAQIANINADTKKKESETKLTESQRLTEELTQESMSLKNTYDLQTLGNRVEKMQADAAIAIERAIAEKWANKITESTLNQQIEQISQNLLNSKMQYELLKANKDLTRQQITESLEKINLMSAQIYRMSVQNELDEAYIKEIAYKYEWEYITKQDAFQMAKIGIDTIKMILDLLPKKMVQNFIQYITNENGEVKEIQGTTTTTTTKGK